MTKQTKISAPICLSCGNQLSQDKRKAVKYCSDACRATGQYARTRLARTLEKLHARKDQLALEKLTKDRLHKLGHPSPEDEYDHVEGLIRKYTYQLAGLIEDSRNP